MEETEGNHETKGVTWIPVPPSVTSCGELLAATSVTDNAAAAFPTAAGVKTIPTEQLSPGLITDSQVLIRENRLAALPVIANVGAGRLAFPVFVITSN
jgi:hypothetical protein